MTIKIVAISDTHSMHRQVSVPDGDILVHAGDMSGHGSWPEFIDFAEWLDNQPHTHKVFVFGNHDGYDVKKCKNYLSANHPSLKLLYNEPADIAGLKFWGSPFTPEFCDWYFMKDRGNDLAQIWNMMPPGTDVLVTHGPAYGHGDQAPPYRRFPRAVGCLELLKKIVEIKPKLHIFGHIHCGYGVTESDEVDTIFVNAATCNEAYQPIQPPQVILI